MTSAAFTDADVADAVRRGTAEQGLPEFIDDPVALRRVASLLRPVLQNDTAAGGNRRRVTTSDGVSTVAARAS